MSQGGAKGRCEINQAIAISTPRARGNFGRHFSCCHVRLTRHACWALSKRWLLANLITCPIMLLASYLNVVHFVFFVSSLVFSSQNMKELMLIFTRLLTVDDRVEALQARTRSFKSAVVTYSIAPAHKQVSWLMCNTIFAGEHARNGLVLPPLSPLHQ